MTSTPRPAHTQARVTSRCPNRALLVSWTSSSSEEGEEERSGRIDSQEWLDVEDDFEAREVGRARGGWESFRDDAGEQATTAFTPLESDAAYDDCAEYDDGYY